MTEDEERYLLVGKMIVFAGELEWTIGTLAAHFTGQEWDGPILANSWSVNRRTVRKAAVDRGETPERLALLGRIFGECERAFEQRHQYVHGLWTYTHTIDNMWEQVAPSATRTRKDGSLERKIVAADDLVVLQETFSRLGRSIRGWARGE